jgi:hypothetical protein
MPPPKTRDPATGQGDGALKVVLPGKLNTSDSTTSDLIVEPADGWRLRVKRAAEAYMRRRHPVRRHWRRS